MLVALVLLLGTFLALPRTAVAGYLPHDFEGAVAGGVAGSTEVYAEIDGVLYGQDSQWAGGGYSGTQYALKVTGDQFETNVPKQGGVDGDAVIFWIKNGATLSVAGESAVFSAGAGPTTLDLTVPGGQPAAWPQLSEVNPENAVNDFVEIYNPGVTDLTLDVRWSLASNDVLETFPSLIGVVVPAGGYSPPVNISLLDVLDPVSVGDSLKLTLTDPALAGGRTIVVDRLEYGNPTKGADAMGLAKQAGATACIPATNSLCVWDINVAGSGSGQTLIAGQSFHRSVPADTDRFADWTVGPPTPVYPTTAPPAIVITGPAAGAHLAGNQAQTATWTVTDTDSAPTSLNVWVNYSETGIAPWTNIFTGDGTGNTQGWTPACANADVSTATLMGTAIDPDGNVRSDSRVFRVDCRSPTVTTVPVDNSVVAPTVAVVLTFNEDMVEGPTALAFDLDGGAVTPAWTTPNRVASVAHVAWLDGSAHQFNVTCGAIDTASPGGNPLAGCVYNFNWTVSAAANTAPTIAISAPAGGEVWSNASLHNIAFAVNDLEDPDANLLVTLEYSNDGGTSWNPIVSARPGDQTPYSWTPTTVCGTILVRGTVTDTGALTGTATTPSLLLDCIAPSVDSTTPPNAAPSVNVVSNVVIDFSEAMAQVATFSAVTLTGPGGVTITGHSWDVTGQILTLQHAANFQPGQTYTVDIACTATDLSDPGNALTNCPYSFSFTTAIVSPPILTFVSPAGGETWSGLSSHTIAWQMLDDGGNLTLVVNLTYKVGATPTAIVNGLTGLFLYAWTLPCENVTAVVNASVVDTGGLTAWSESSPFVIDCARPTVISTTPVDGATAVGTTADIVIQFSEPVVTATAEAPCASSVPTLAGPVFTWNATNDTLTITHSGLLVATNYVLTLCSTVRDTSDPGLTMGAAATFDFTTAGSGVDTTDPVIGGIGVNPASPEEGQSVTISCTSCTDNVGIVSYAWVVRASNGTTTNASGSSFTHTFAAAGSYTVTVTVRDAAGNVATDQVTVTVRQAGTIDGGGGEFPWWIIVVIIVVLVLLLLFFLMRRKKKEPEETPPAGGTPAADEIPPPTEEKLTDTPTSGEGQSKPEAEKPAEGAPAEEKPAESATESKPAEERPAEKA